MGKHGLGRRQPTGSGPAPKELRMVRAGMTPRDA